MTRQRIAHAPNTVFDVIENHLMLGGKRVSEIVKNFGLTPLYIYDSAAIEKRIDELREVLPTNVHLHYAIKANPMPDVVNLIAPLVDGLDVASGGEVPVALASGTLANCVSFAGPGKQYPELRLAIERGITINVESPLELQRIVEICTELDVVAPVAIRVNPDFELKSSGMKMSGGPKQFGIDAEKVPEILRSLHSLPVDFRGFHIFSGSQNLREEAIIEAQCKSLDLAFSLSEFAPKAPATINIGGGFGIPYFPGESRLDIQPLGDNLRSLGSQLAMRFEASVLVLELGRFIVGEAGIYVSRIIDRKESRGHTFLIADGGLHHHLSLSGNFGQVLRKNYPVIPADNVSSDDVEEVSIVGPLCTPLDILADRMILPKLDVGDLVAVPQSGAYGFTASPLGFLSHPAPGQIVV